MHPALSVVFFTTLAGAAQGLVLALVTAEWLDRWQGLGPVPDGGLFAVGAAEGVSGLVTWPVSQSEGEDGMSRVTSHDVG